MVERRAVCLLACRPDGKVLAIYRNNNPIGWGLVGGKVDPGETDEQALVRESMEEAGVTVVAMQKVYERRSTVTKADGQEETWIVPTFQGLITGELRGSEEGRVAWVSMYDLIEGPFGEYNLKLFKSVGCEIHCYVCEDSGEIAEKNSSAFGIDYLECPRCHGEWSDK